MAWFVGGCGQSTLHSVGVIDTQKIYNKNLRETPVGTIGPKAQRDTPTGMELFVCYRRSNHLFK